MIVIIFSHRLKLPVPIKPAYKPTSLPALAEVNIPKGRYFSIWVSVRKGSLQEDFCRVSVISH